MPLKFKNSISLHDSCLSSTGCFLSRGWEQLEATCNPTVHHGNNLWNVEGHENERGIAVLRSLSLKHLQSCTHRVFLSSVSVKTDGRVDIIGSPAQFGKWNFHPQEINQTLNCHTLIFFLQNIIQSWSALAERWSKRHDWL